MAKPKGLGKLRMWVNHHLLILWPSVAAELIGRQRTPEVPWINEKSNVDRIPTVSPCLAFSITPL